MKLETKCGATEWCVRFPQDHEAGGAPLPPKGEALRATLLLRRHGGVCAEGFDRVWVDNRGGPSRKLELGYAAHTVPADSTFRIDVASPPCAGMGTIVLDGTHIGTLPVIEQGLEFTAYGNKHDFLIDAGASRCYRSTRVTYGISNSGPDNDLYKKAPLHALAHPIDAFLKEVPDSIRAYGGGHRTQLVDMPCEP